jgi:hypothetical protein
MTTSPTGRHATGPDRPGTRRLKYHGPRAWTDPLVEQLRDRRYALGISQEELAEMVHMASLIGIA